MGFRVARQARDLFGELLAVGIASLIGLQAFLHIGVGLGGPSRDRPVPAVHLVRAHEPRGDARRRGHTAGHCARGPGRPSGPFRRRLGDPGARTRRGAGMMVVFSGGGTAGHFHPARNIAEALTGEVPGVQPYFVGTEGRVEAAELPGLGYPYRLIPVEGLRSPPGARRGSGGVGRLFGLVSAAAANARALWLMARAVARLVPDFRRRGAAGGRGHRGLRLGARRDRRVAAGTSGRGAGAEPQPGQDHPACGPLGSPDSPRPSGGDGRVSPVAPANGLSTPATPSVPSRRRRSGTAKPPAGRSACPSPVR